LKISDVINALDETLGQHFFPAAGTGKDPRVCPVCVAFEIVGRARIVGRELL